MRNLSFILILFALVACEPKNNSDVKIIGSTARHLSGSQNKVPGVMNISTNRSGFCTAQAVSDSTMISAAHCFRDHIANTGFAEVCIESGENTGACSTNVYMPDQFLDRDPTEFVYDVAIVEFELPIFNQYFNVRHQSDPVSIGSDFYIVGYSPNENISANAAQCAETGCWGTTALIDISHEYETLTAPDGRAFRGDAITDEPVTLVSNLQSGSTTNRGDSGGGAIDFEFCSLFGVLSRGTGNSALHTNLTAPDVQKWLVDSPQNYDSNIYICGLHGNDPNRCSLEGVYHRIRVEVENEVNCVTLNTKQPFQDLLDEI